MEKDWSSLSENFDDLQRLVTGEAIDKSIKFELSQLQNLGNLLELGCGNCNYTKSLIENSKSILSTDISEEMVRVAREKLKDFSNVEVQQSNCYDTGLESKYYDTVVMANLIHVVSQPETAIKEVRRLLKDNGRLVIVSFTIDGLQLQEKIKLVYRFIKNFGSPPKGGTKFSLNSLKDFVSNHKFEIEEARLLEGKMSNAIFIVARKK